MEHDQKPQVEPQHVNPLSPESWLIKDLDNLKPEPRELFEKYSKVPPDEVVPHIKQFRDKAFKVYPYPCLGHWGFLDLSIRQIPQYDEILQRVKDGDKYLDIGCCVGQDIRKLVYDGAPSENTYGCDLQKDFMEIGYDLFLDKSTLKTTFIAADVFNTDSDLKQLEGKIDIVHGASFFHLFDWEGQVQAAKRVVSLLKSKPGGLIVGRQAGNVTCGESARRLDSNRTRYRHNEESWAKMWKQVGDETGTKWDVDVKLDDQLVVDRKGLKWDFVPEGTRFMTFTLRKL